MCCHCVKMNRGASWRWVSHRQAAERWGDLMAPWVLGSEFIAIYMRRCLCRMSSQSSKVSVIKLESGSRCIKDHFKDPSDIDKADYQTRKFVGWTNTETNDDVFAHPSYLHYICVYAYVPQLFCLSTSSVKSPEARKALFPTLQTSDLKAKVRESWKKNHCSVKPVRVQYRVIIKNLINEIFIFSVVGNTRQVKTVSWHC